MSNSYFRFKHFIVRQDQCVMKVCTDSCILGAWSAFRVAGAKRILDIGTGTGLLSLMLAQKSDARIDAIEWDHESRKQAGENLGDSPWSDRIQLLEGDTRVYPFPNRYDFIISNPPFFESDLRSPEQRKNKAKHNESLTLDELIAVTKKNLQPNGAFSILLPHHRNDYFETLALANGFFLREKLIIRQTASHLPFRTIGLYNSENDVNETTDELIIKNKEGKYSPEFSDLMKEYYL